MGKGFTRQGNTTPKSGVAKGFTRTYRHFSVAWQNPETGEVETLDVTYRSKDDSVKKILADKGIDINDCLVEPLE